jgi:hypothetical protein
MKENLEKISQDYLKKNEILEQKYEHILFQNNDLLEKVKKLELFTKYQTKFSSTNQGIKLDNIMLMTESNESLEKDDASGDYGGYMKVNLKPTKLANSSKRPLSMSMNFNHNHAVNKDVLIRDIRDINQLSSNILQKKELYSKVCFLI